MSGESNAGRAITEDERAAIQRRARRLLVTLVVLLVVGSAGGWFGWQAYEHREQLALAERIKADGGLNQRPRPRPRAPVAPPGFLEEMARRQEQSQNLSFQEAMTAYFATPADGRDAYLNKLLTTQRARFQRAVATAATRPTGDGRRAEFITALSKRLAATGAKP